MKQQKGSKNKNPKDENLIFEKLNYNQKKEMKNWIGTSKETSNLIGRLNLCLIYKIQFTKKVYLHINFYFEF